MKNSAKSRQKGKPKNPKFTPDIGKNTQFTSTKQPSPAVKSQGMLKNKTLREILLMGLHGTDENSANLRSMLSKFLNIPEKELTKDLIFRVAMDLRMIQKVLSKSDANAYRTLYELAGLSEQEVKVNMLPPIIIDTTGNGEPTTEPDKEAG